MNTSKSKNSANPLKDLGFSKKLKGCGKIYTHPNLEYSIVDRQGYGINSAMGYSVTYKGQAFPNVNKAAESALCDVQNRKVN